MSKVCVLSVLALVCACCSSCFAGTVYNPPGSHWANEHLGNWNPGHPDQGLEFATIGNPGNRGANDSERLDGFISSKFWPTLGSVNHRYRISTTEVSANQWFPFFQAFLPRYIESGGSGFDGMLRSEHISIGGPFGFEVNRGEERSAVRVGWVFAARYCNWLHNGAPTGPDVPLEVFQTGAYEMPALTGSNYDPKLLPQAHNEGAKYWLPSIDEWVKAAHYDPDRYGEGEEGYWLRMGGQDEPLTQGLPWEGGQTSSDPNLDTNGIPVAAYGDVVSPWGLFDTSGSESEWTDTVGVRHFFGGELDPENRYILGSSINVGSNPLLYDTTDGLLLEYFAGLSVSAGQYGFRVASLVPSPGASSLLAFGALLAARRRR
jgi:hypothetical protein